MNFIFKLFGPIKLAIFTFLGSSTKEFLEISFTTKPDTKKVFLNLILKLI